MRVRRQGTGGRFGGAANTARRRPFRRTTHATSTRRRRQAPLPGGPVESLRGCVSVAESIPPAPRLGGRLRLGLRLRLGFWLGFVHHRSHPASLAGSRHGSRRRACKPEGRADSVQVRHHGSRQCLGKPGGRRPRFAPGGGEVPARRNRPTRRWRRRNLRPAARTRQAAPGGRVEAHHPRESTSGRQYPTLG